MKIGNEKLSGLLDRMETYAGEHDLPILRRDERQIFLNVTAAARPRQILEIGTAIGYSALLLAAAAPEAQLTTLEHSHELADIAEQFWAEVPEYQARIRLLRGDAGEILTRLAGSPGDAPRYDLVFIDAAKGQYPDYWYKIQPLLRPGAVVIADDVLYHGYVRPRGPRMVPRRQRTIVKRLREYLDIVGQYDTELLPQGDGMAITRIRETESGEAND